MSGLSRITKGFICNASVESTINYILPVKVNLNEEDQGFLNILDDNVTIDLNGDDDIKLQFKSDNDSHLDIKLTTENKIYLKV